MEDVCASVGEELTFRGGVIHTLHLDLVLCRIRT